MNEKEKVFFSTANASMKKFDPCNFRTEFKTLNGVIMESMGKYSEIEKKRFKFRGQEFSEGDKIEVTIPTVWGGSDVKYVGEIIFFDGAFSIKHEHMNSEVIDPLCNFTNNCEFKKVEL